MTISVYVPADEGLDDEIACGVTLTTDCYTFRCFLEPAVRLVGRTVCLELF